jgi:hypothetical protein
MGLHSKVPLDATSQDEAVGPVHPQAMHIDNVFDGSPALRLFLVEAL